MACPYYGERTLTPTLALAPALTPNQVACPYCGKKMKNDRKLAFHNRWFCGPNAQKSAAQSKTQSGRRKKQVSPYLAGPACLAAPHCLATPLAL